MPPVHVPQDVPHVGSGPHAVLLQSGMQAHEPQSVGQVSHVSPTSQFMLPQTGPPPGPVVEVP
jgi:hypothetical protein